MATPLALMVALASLTGCAGDDDGTFIPQPTRIIVDPLRFLGDVPCSNQDGAMRSYVVTLHMWEDEDDVEPFTLGSSYPTPCSRRVSFRDVLTPGMLYTAEVDAYDPFADELRPYGESSSGSRQMHDTGTGEIVTPRWTTRCGSGPSQATMAIENEAHIIGHCLPLVDSTPSVTAIQFPPAVALGSDPCTTAATVDILPDGSALPAALGVPCDGAPVLFDQDIIEGRAYTFYATAEGADGTVGTECFVTARAGLAVTPQCTGIRATGEVSLSLDGLLAGEESLCPAGHRYDVALGGELLNSVPLACEAAALIGPLSPNDYTLDVVVIDPDGQPYAPGASCRAVVAAGRTARATCMPNPSP